MSYLIYKLQGGREKPPVPKCYLELERYCNEKRDRILELKNELERAVEPVFKEVSNTEVKQGKFKIFHKFVPVFIKNKF